MAAHCLQKGRRTRTVERGPDDAVREAMAAQGRTPAGAALYRQRKGIVEPALGISRRCWGSASSAAGASPPRPVNSRCWRSRTTSRSWPGARRGRAVTPGRYPAGSFCLRRSSRPSTIPGRPPSDYGSTLVRPLPNAAELRGYPVLPDIGGPTTLRSVICPVAASIIMCSSTAYSLGAPEGTGTGTNTGLENFKIISQTGREPLIVPLAAKAGSSRRSTPYVVRVAVSLITYPACAPAIFKAWARVSSCVRGRTEVASPPARVDARA